MIYTPLSTYVRTNELPLNATASPAQEGQALVRSFTGETFGAAISNNNAGENFLGFLIAQVSAVPFLQLTAVKTERFTLPSSPMTIQLSQAAISSATTFVYDVTSSAATVADSVSAAGLVTLTTNGTANHVYDITYRYNLTALQAQSLNGSVVVGGWNGLITGTVSVLIAGRIYTDQFDTGKNWMAATAVKTGLAGIVTDQTGSGATLNASVIATPSTTFPFLGLEFSAY